MEKSMTYKDTLEALRICGMTDDRTCNECPAHAVAESNCIQFMAICAAEHMARNLPDEEKEDG